MKTLSIKKIFFLFILTGTLISCKKDFLDLEPMDRIPNDAVFQDPVLIRSYLAKLYGDVQYEGFNYFEGWDVFFITLTSKTDEGTGSYGTDSQSFEIFSDDWFNIWPYDHIRECNSYIQNLKTANVSDEDKKLLDAEVRFIRAFHYWNLVKRFGGVPLITVPQEYTGEESLDDLQVQ